MSICAYIVGVIGGMIAGYLLGRIIAKWEE
jgi:hypothetical protein